MAKRENHYEAAFEALLRGRRIPYVAVDERRRALWGDRSLKSLDYIVSPSGGPCSYLVDIKGRRFPGGGQFWRNWTTSDDLCSLTRWSELFGPGFVCLLVFAYQVVGRRAPVPPEELLVHGGRLYGFVGMRLDHYAAAARRISPKWDTVAMPTGDFRRRAQPVLSLLTAEMPAPMEAVG